MYEEVVLTIGRFVVTQRRISKLVAAAFICAVGYSAPFTVFAADSAQEAFKLYQAKRYREAAQLFESSVSVANPNPTICYYAAISNQQAGNLPRAKSLYKQVMQLSPSSTIGQYAQSVLAKLDPSASLSGGTAGAGSLPNISSYSPSMSAASSGVSGPDEGAVYYKGRGNEISVPVEVNNRTIEMVLDTGAPGITLGKQQLESAGIRAPEGRAVGRTGGSSNSDTQDFWIMPATVKVGPFTVANSQVKVLANNHAEPLLGQGFLQYFDYTVDQSARCIRLRRKGSAGATANKQGLFIPFEFRESGSRIIVNVEVNGRGGPMILDTGNTASGISFLSVDQAKQYGCAPPEDARSSTHTGVSGSGRCLEYNINRARLGPIDKSNLHVSVHLATEANEPPLLGHAFFEGWQYNIDLKERKIWLLRR